MKARLMNRTSSPCAWTCPTCGKLVTTRFCATCGESPISPREQTLRGLAERLFQAFTSIDTKTARSVWTLIRQPGQLTVSWTNGIRKPYVAPITLFLLINVLFFAVQSLTGGTVFSSHRGRVLHLSRCRSRLRHDGHSAHAAGIPAGDRRRGDRDRLSLRAVPDHAVYDLKLQGGGEDIHSRHPLKRSL